MSRVAAAARPRHGHRGQHCHHAEPFPAPPHGTSPPYLLRSSCASAPFETGRCSRKAFAGLSARRRRSLQDAGGMSAEVGEDRYPASSRSRRVLRAEPRNRVPSILRTAHTGSGGSDEGSVVRVFASRVAVFYETAGMSVALDSKVLDESNVRPHQFSEPMRWIQTYRDNLSGQCVRHERSTLNEPPGFGETPLTLASTFSVTDAICSSYDEGHQDQLGAPSSARELALSE
jgi:hypothetical protein